MLVNPVRAVLAAKYWTVSPTANPCGVAVVIVAPTDEPIADVLEVTVLLFVPKVTTWSPAAVFLSIASPL